MPTPVNEPAAASEGGPPGDQTLIACVAGRRSQVGRGIGSTTLDRPRRVVGANRRGPQDAPGC